MPTVGTLSPKKINIDTLPNGRHRLDSNLYVQVNGVYRTFYFIYSFGNKRKYLSLGPTYKKTITQVKQEVIKCRALVADGIDPMDIREEKKLKSQKNTDNPTLREFYESIVDDIVFSHNLKTDSSKQIYTRTFNLHILSNYGDIKVQSFNTDLIVSILKPLWTTKTRTAAMLRCALEIVFAYAKKKDVFHDENPAVWKNNLDMYLPRAREFHETVHRRHLEPCDFPKFMCRISVWNWCRPKRMTPKVILFVALTVCRHREVSELKWSEVDFEKRLLTIPTERLKIKRGPAFQVTLSNQAVWLLKSLQPLTGDQKFVFKGLKPGRPISPESTDQFLAKEATCLHGFRATFRTWAAENNINDNVAERCLSHAIGRTPTERSYLRTEYIEQRFDVLQKWADFILPMEVLTAEFLTEEQIQKLWPFRYSKLGFHDLREKADELGLNWTQEKEK